MRLSSVSWRISSELRKQENGRKRRVQHRASMQVDSTSEPAGIWVTTHTHTYRASMGEDIYT